MTHIFSLIAFLVLLVSVSSVFVESAYAAEADAIAVILGITYENIQESFADAGIDPEKDPVFVAAQEEYFEALAALETGDIVTAEESALKAMELFEISAENIGEVEDQASTQLSSGLGTAAASIFNVQEGITNSDNEAKELRELVELNNLNGIDFGTFEEAVNLAKTLLANGIAPDAQAQLALANEIKDDIYAKIQDAAAGNSIDGIEEFLEDQENLGLTKNEIKELEEMVEDLSYEGSNVSGNSASAPGQSEDSSPGNSASAPGQSEDSSPGNSASAPGQSEDSSPGNSASASGQSEDSSPGNSGKIPPGLAKLFGYNDGTEDNKDFEAPEGFAPLPPGISAAIDQGLGKIPPGLYIAFNDKPDDFFENHYEAEVDDVWKVNFDGTNRGSSEGKGMFGAWAGKSGEAPGQEVRKDKGKSCSTDKGLNGDLTDIIISIASVFTIEGYTATGNSCKDATSQIQFTVVAPNNTSLFTANAAALTGLVQPETFDPDTNGNWIIKFRVQGFNEDRTLTVSDGITADAGIDRTGVPAGLVTHSGSSDVSVGTVTYSWEITNIPGGPAVTLEDDDPLDGDIKFTALTPKHSGKTFELTLTVRDDNGWASDIVLITIS